MTWGRMSSNRVYVECRDCMELGVLGEGWHKELLSTYTYVCKDSCVVARISTTIRALGYLIPFDIG